VTSRAALSFPRMPAAHTEFFSPIGLSTRRYARYYALLTCSLRANSTEVRYRIFFFSTCSRRIHAHLFSARFQRQLPLAKLVLTTRFHSVGSPGLYNLQMNISRAHNIVEHVCSLFQPTVGISLFGILRDARGETRVWILIHCGTYSAVLVIGFLLIILP